MTEFVNEVLRDEWAKQQELDRKREAERWARHLELLKLLSRFDEPNYKHRDGVWWHDAPLPRRLHRCSAWTTGWVGLSPVYRCACGAISRGGRHWMERNSRRKSRSKKD